MATPGEGLLGRDFSFEIAADSGVYTFIIRGYDSPTVPKWSVVEVRDPNGVKVVSYPDTVSDYITVCMTFLKAQEEPTFDVDPLVVSYEAVYEGPSPDPEVVIVTNDGDFGSLLDWAVTANRTWASASPDDVGGIRQDQYTDVSLGVYTEDLAVGTYVVNWVFADASASNTPQTVVGTVVIIPKATISLSVATLAFAGTVGGANPASQTFVVGNSGPVGSKLNFTVGIIEATATWITPAPTSGGPLVPGATTTVTVAISTTGLSVGVYHATIRVTDETASNDPRTIAVTLTMT